MNHSLIKSGFWTAYGAIAIRFCALLSNLVLARLLLPSEFGVIGIAWVFWSFVALFTQDTTGSFIVYKGTEDRRYLNTTYTISLIIGLTFGLGLVTVSPLIASFFGEQNLVWLLIGFAFNFLLSSAYCVYAGVMTRQMQYRELAYSALISSITRLLFTTGSALLGLSYWSFLIGDTASWLILCILTRYQSGHHFRLQIDSEAKSEVLSYCLGAVGSSFGYFVNANIDNFVVGKLLGSTSLGYYNLAYQMTMSLSVVFSQVIAQLGMPVFAQIVDDRQSESTLVKVVEQIAFLTAPLYALFFLVIDKQVISLLFGPKWIPICTVIPGLLIFAYFRVLNTPLNSMLSAKGRPEVNARVNLYIAPLAVVSFVIGALNGGIVGVSIAVALVLGIFWTVIWWWVGCRELGWSMMKFLIACFIPALIACPAIAISFSLPLILKPLIFISTYIVCVRIIVPEQFFSYQTLAGRFVNQIPTLWNKK